MKVRHNICFIVIMLLASLFGFSAMQTTAYAEEVIPKATDQFYVNDFADVFSPEQEEVMQQRAVALAEKPEGVQVVVTTVTTLSGYTVDEYATMMYNDYQIGLDSRGILILLSTGERQIRVEVGDGLAQYYNDEKAGNAIDKYALDYLRDNKFDIGLMNLQEKIVAELDEHFDIVSEDPKRDPVMVEPKSVPSTESSHSNIGWIAISISFFIGLVFVGFLYYEEKIKHQSDSESYEKTIHEKNQRINELESSFSSMRNTSNRNADNCELLRSENGSLRRTLESCRSDNSKLQKDVSELGDRYKKLQSDYEDLSAKFERAKKLHPDLYEEIDEDIRREIDKANHEAAREFDSEYGYLQNREPSGSDLTFRFDDAFSAYKALTDEQKQLVQTDMAKVRQVYEQILKLREQDRAQSLNRRLENLCKSSSVGTESRLSEYNQLYADYQRLNSSAQGFVSGALLEALSSLIADGEREKSSRIARENAIRAQREAEEHRRREDQRRREEEDRRRREDERRREEEDRRRREDERRRREEEDRRRREEEEEEEEARRRRNSSSSSSFGSHHSGFGGHSSGGGASRGF